VEDITPHPDRKRSGLSHLGEAGCGVISEVRGFFHTLKSGNPWLVTFNSEGLNGVSAGTAA